MYVLSVQYSCAVVSVFLFGGKANLVLLTLFYSTLLTHTGKANLVLLTLFYSTLLTLTDGQTDGEMNTLASLSI